MRFADMVNQLTGSDTIAVIIGNPTAPSCSDPDVRNTLNCALDDALNVPILTLESGYLKIKTVLEDAGFDFDPLPPTPAEEGDEIYALTENAECYLYIAFFEDDHGFYEFHAEIVTEDELDEILSIE